MAAGAAELRRAVDCLTGNFTICPPVLSQIAAVAAFTPEASPEADGNLHHYAAEPRLLLDGLREIGLDRLAPTDGAFYVYADVSDYTADSLTFCSKLLADTGVAIAPGCRLRHRARQLVRPVVIRRADRRHRGGRAADRTLAFARLSVENLSDAGLERPAFADVVHVDSESVAQGVDHGGGVAEANLLAALGPVDGQIASVRFTRASAMSRATIRPVTNWDDGCVETNQLPTSRSIGGWVRVVNS